MNKGVLSFLIASAFLAGCADNGQPSDDPVVDPGVQFESDVLQLSLPTMPREAPLPGERTLDKAPEWRLGEWWTYTLTDGFAGNTYEFTRVVAGQDKAAGNYLVGFPLEEFNNDVMLFHTPGFGDIRQSDLSYETHDAVFQMLQFPLRDGDSWEAEFEGTGKGPVTVAATGTTAEVELISPQYNVVATYDAELGEFSKMSINNGSYEVYEVTGHGYNYEGVIRVPHAHDLIFINGRLAGAQDLAGPTGTAAGPTETIVVGAGYDRAAFILAVGAGPFLGVSNAVPVGVFRETATAPDGTVYQLQLLPHEGGFKIAAFGHENPEGTWTLEHIAAGAGVAFIEGIGYHSIDVDLPSGCVINSFNAQHHNSECKINQDQAGSINATTAP
ncbi:MAG: hypothetical protein WC876_00890 [Candidatus Thermoplasmatota archaeon]